jgi:6-pyruvoyltetrahydropterin/6-carboxytetrahydropterin synthase
MPRYRVCRRFTVESGHMLSRHPEACRFPHGHTRTVEVVVSADALDANGMVVDFKALKFLCEDLIDAYDHATAVNTDDPFYPDLARRFPPEALVPFESEEPTTEAMARRLFEGISGRLASGFGRPPYQIPPGRVRLERVRVGETPNSWAEVEA